MTLANLLNYERIKQIMKKKYKDLELSSKALGAAMFMFNLAKQLVQPIQKEDISLGKKNSVIWLCTMFNRSIKSFAMLYVLPRRLEPCMIVMFI